MHRKICDIYLDFRFFDYLCRPKTKSGEIWLLATTLKNAKMLTTGHQAMVTAFISMFCVFVTAPHLCGAYFLFPGPELPETGKKGECFRKFQTGKQGHKHRRQG